MENVFKAGHSALAIMFFGLLLEEIFQEGVVMIER